MRVLVSEQKPITKNKANFWILFLFRIPILRRLTSLRFKFLLQEINWLHLNGDIKGLLKLIYRNITRKYFKLSSNQIWSLLRFVMILQQQSQLQFSSIQDEALPKDILNYIENNNALERVGYDCSYVYLSLSMHYFHQNNIKKAIYFLKYAGSAEPEWGYPKYLMGWYLLIGGQQEESLSYFTEAVALDWSFLGRINQDPICRKYPELLKIINSKVIVK